MSDRETENQFPMAHQSSIAYVMHHSEQHVPPARRKIDDSIVWSHQSTNSNWQIAHMENMPTDFRPATQIQSSENPIYSSGSEYHGTTPSSSIDNQGVYVAHYHMPLLSPLTVSNEELSCKYLSEAPSSRALPSGSSENASNVNFQYQSTLDIWEPPAFTHTTSPPMQASQVLVQLVRRHSTGGNTPGISNALAHDCIVSNSYAI